MGPGANTLKLNPVVSEGIWWHISPVPAVGAAAKAGSKSNAIIHLHGVGAVDLVMDGYASEVSWRPVDVPCLFVVVVPAIGADGTTFCFDYTCYKAMNSLPWSYLSAAQPHHFF